MSSKYVIGVDLGGTKILTALADQEGKILQRVLVDTGANEPAEKVVERIITTVERVIREAGVEKTDVQRIGVGSPGPLDIQQGIVLFSPNLRWHHVHIVKQMQDALGIPVLLENDANAAAMAEHAFGAGRGSQHMIYMTISTGIGGGVIINGQILHGSSDSGGEIGHHTIEPHGPQCGCGNPGCLEALASGTALGRYGREAYESGVSTKIRELAESVQEVNGSTVTRAAEAGDPVALEIVAKVAEYIGIGIANMINIFNPEKIVLGGGVMKAGHLFMGTILETVEKRALEAPRKRCEILFSELGSDVGVLGAIAVALNR